MVKPCLLGLLICLILAASPVAPTTRESSPTTRDSLGIFEAHQDVGTVLHPGAAVFDPAAKTYTVSGSGENMWAAADAFHYLWKKVSGDISLAADISFVGATGDPHRKACLVIRQTLDADSPYCDVALHGEGLTSLQFREEKAGPTRQIQANTSAPKRLRIEKRGSYIYMALAAEGEQLHHAGGSMRIEFQEPFYIGLGVCAHNKDQTQTAIFSNVDLAPILPAVAGRRPTLYSTVETITVSSKDRRVSYVIPERIEAPNWTRDGSLLFNGGGKLQLVPSAGGKPQIIDTGFANRCNNDHGISPDGKLLAISDQSQGDRKSTIYIVPIEGGTPRKITQNAPSYFHGWAPDGKSVIYCGDRGGEFDIYSISIDGGDETRLTTAKGLDDGPEYSPDGNYIYFNSERTGSMQIWRMKPDGTEQEQVTTDDLNNWFPHISPNGRSMVFLTYDKGVTGHPADKDVTLKLMNLSTKRVEVLAKLFGGQGTINVASWSPDSLKFAFVSYQYLP